jgi:hypothetical protein
MYQPLTEAVGYIAKLSVSRMPIARSTSSNCQSFAFSV